MIGPMNYGAPRAFYGNVSSLGAAPGTGRGVPTFNIKALADQMRAGTYAQSQMEQAVQLDLRTPAQVQEDRAVSRQRAANVAAARQAALGGGSLPWGWILGGTAALAGGLLLLGVYRRRSGRRATVRRRMAGR